MEDVAAHRALGEPSATEAIGEHTLQFYAPDLIVVRYRNTVEGPEVARMNEQIRRFFPGNQPMYLIADTTEIQVATPEGRSERFKFYRQRQGPSWIASVASRAPHIARLLSLFFKAARLLLRNVNIQQFSTREDALVWLRNQGAKA